MKRRAAARPDQVLTITGPEGEQQIPYVSREQMRELMLDGEAMLAMAGGVFTIAVDRVRTDVEGEMLTIQALAEWKDRPDARAQAEREAPQAAPAPAPEPAEDAEEAIAQLEAELEADDAPAGELLADDPDAPDEDLSSIPTHLRSAV